MAGEVVEARRAPARTAGGRALEVRIEFDVGVIDRAVAGLHLRTLRGIERLSRAAFGGLCRLRGAVVEGTTVDGAIRGVCILFARVRVTPCGGVHFIAGLHLVIITRIARIAAARCRAALRASRDCNQTNSYG